MVHNKVRAEFWFDLLKLPSARARSSAVFNLVYQFSESDAYLDNIVHSFARIVEMDPVLSVRRDAMWGLMEIGAESFSALPTIIDAARDPDDIIRWYAIIALRHIGRRGAYSLPVLVEALSEANPGLRVHAAEAISSIGFEPLSDFLTMAGWPLHTWAKAQEDAPDFICELISLAWGFKNEEGATVLRILIDDSRPSVRRCASAALTMLGGEIGDTLDVALRHWDATVRFFAAASLHYRPDAKHKLKALLCDPDFDVRYIAGWLLSNM